MLYSTLNPATGVTDGRVNAAAQVLEGAVMTGADGKTTKELLLVQLALGVEYVAVKQPAVDGVKTPVEGSIEPPPDTDQVPPSVPFT